jgi:soluble lytic murein transglycosylase-like protein
MDISILKQFAKSSRGAVVATLHNGLAFIGLVSLLIIISQGGSLLPDAKARNSAPAFGTIRYDGISLFEPADESSNPRQKALATYLSRKYKVSIDATEQLVAAAHEVGGKTGVDPLLILAVMAIESRFNPIAESVGGAKGLMQVIPKFHQDKLEAHGGEDAVLDPMTNITVGSRILKEYIRRTGSVESALQYYAGALDDTSSQYAQKVMAEYQRLHQTAQRAPQPLQPPPLKTAAVG